MSLKTATLKVQMSLKGNYNKPSAANDQSVVRTLNEALAWSFASGPSAMQITRIYRFSGIATTTPAMACELSGTSVDDFGDVTDLTKVRVIAVKHKMPGGTRLWLGGGSNYLIDFQNPVAIRAGIDNAKQAGWVIFLYPDTNGLPVAPATADKLQIAAESGSIPWEVIVAGVGP